MRGIRPLSLALTALALLPPPVAAAHEPPGARAALGARGATRFERVATLPNYLNDMENEGEVGVIDIADPADVSGGKLGVGGEPTSAAVFGENLALVAVNASESFTKPSLHPPTWLRGVVQSGEGYSVDWTRCELARG